MSTLPDAWEQVDFDDAVNVVSDRGLRIKQKDYLPSGSLAVVDQGEGLVGGYTNDLGAQVESAGPVIVFGDHTRRFKYVRFPFAVGADGVKLFSANAAWNPEFLFQQLAALNLEDRGYGRHFQCLRKERLALPPFVEQARIVAKLEELLSDLDAGLAELKAAQKKLHQYRQSLLKAAVEGALTAPWREAQRKLGNPTETGAQLLQRILTERRARWEAKQLAKFKEQGKAPPKDWQKKYPEPVQPDTTDLPELPEGWVWASVEQLGNVTTGFTPSTTDAENFGGAVPFFKPSDLDAGYSVIAARDYLTEKGASAGRVLPALSVLVTCIGATIGKTGLARVACTTNQQINSISVDPDSAVPEFIFWFMNSGLGQRQIVNSASATTLPILNKSRFQRLAVPLPSRAEQQEMVRCIDAEVERCTQLAVSLNLSLKQSTAQRQNILRAAFAGQLVPQDPNDEPASVLLERIRAERGARATLKTPRARKAREPA